jgi:osmotically-inducible protein OsmY
MFLIFNDMMKTNDALQRDVLNAIKWEPLLHASDIGVTAMDGIVTLTGSVDSYAKKMEAEHAAKNVAGVNAVVEKIELKFAGHEKKSDNDFAIDIVSALKWKWEVPSDKISVTVEKGWVTLEGELLWNFQKLAAVAAIKHLPGLTGISNKLTVKSNQFDEIEVKGIEAALHRNWSINAQDINVKVQGSHITLDGTVKSWYQKDEAGRIAWSAPGVSHVNNLLEVVYDYSSH